MKASSSTLKLLWTVVLAATTITSVACFSTTTPTKPTVVVYGIGQSSELTLLTSKMAAKEGWKSYCICSTDKEYACRNLMYGEEYAKAGKDDDFPTKAKPIHDGSSIQCALQEATAIVFVGHDQPIDTSAISMLVETAMEKEEEDDDDAAEFQPLSKVVYLSTMGVTKKGGGGFFGGGGGGDPKIQQSETFLRDMISKTDGNVDLSIVRAGSLKGGGPGPNHQSDDHVEGIDDWGLSVRYYNTLINGVEARVTMAHDKYTLGIGDGAITKGDTIEMPNKIKVMSTKTSTFDPLPYETNRIVAASAIMACITGDKKGKDDVLEFSISGASGNQPPTLEEWNTVLQDL